MQCTLSISLHQVTDEERSNLMPINKKYNIEELMKACRYYIEKTNKRISFEYALAKDKNDNGKAAEELTSPIPINTILDIFLLRSCSAFIICSTISPRR